MCKSFDTINKISGINSNFFNILSSHFCRFGIKMNICYQWSSSISSFT